MLRVHFLRLVFVPLAYLAPACGDSETPVKSVDSGGDNVSGDSGAGDAGSEHTTDGTNSVADAGNPCAAIVTTCVGADDVDGLGNLCLRVSSEGDASACAAVATECLAYCDGAAETWADAGVLDVAACKAMGDTCHDFDTGTGLGNLCHEVGHSGNLTWCSAIYEDCVALCGEPAVHDEDAGARVSFDLRFDAKVGSEPFECGRQYADVGTSNTTITPLDLRFYVSNIRLVTETGEQVTVTVDEIAPYQGGGVALLDFSDGTGGCRENDSVINSSVRVSAPAGNYTGVAFSTSVPSELNHQDPVTLPAPLQAGDMTWGWLAGYKFLKLELQSVNGQDAGASSPADGAVEDAGPNAGSLDAGVGSDASADATTNTSSDAQTTPPADTTSEAPSLVLLHVGSVACSEASLDAGDAPQFADIQCANPNRNEVVFPSFDPNEDVVVLDVAQVVARADLSQSVFCHPVGEGCEPIFAAVGVDYATGIALDTHAAFRVE